MTRTAHWLVVLSGAVAALVAGCNASKPQYATDAVRLMMKYSEQGRYDDAIAVALDWVNKYPNDSLGNAPFLQQISLLYLAKASKEPAHKEESVKQAMLYADKALSIRPDAGAFLQTAIISEAAGDIIPSESCAYYRRSVQELQKQIPFLEQADPRGSRQIAEMSLVRVQRKITNAACK